MFDLLDQMRIAPCGSQGRMGSSGLVVMQPFGVFDSEFRGGKVFRFFGGNVGSDGGGAYRLRAVSRHIV